MSELERRFKQRLVGAVVLVMLAVIFLPMLFDRNAPRRPVVVDAPAMPAVPAEKVAEAPAVSTPEPQAGEPPIDPALAHLDGDGLPVTWALRIASLSQGEAGALQDRLRRQGLDAYMRADGDQFVVNVGPFVERAAAEKQLDALARQGHNPVMIRYQPEAH